MLLTINYMIL